MTNIINLASRRRARLKAKSEAHALCRSGFHKWQTVPCLHLEMRQGRMLTTERCTRCDKERTRSL